MGKDEALIVKFESDATSAPPKSGGFFSYLADTFTGTPHTAAETYQDDRLKAFSEQTVTLPLNSSKGDFRGLLDGTVNFTMTPEQKQHLQAQAHQTVSDHLEKRALVRERHEFASLDDAVMAMDDEMLSSVEEELQKDPAGAETLRFHFQQLLQVGARQALGGASGMSRVLSSAVGEMQRRDIGVKAENFTREVIYPSLYRPGQPAANVELLQRAARDLREATTPAEFNRVLDGIIQYYRARNKPWSTAFSSTTVEQAKAWRIPL